jgi:hypothetical protein
MQGIDNLPKGGGSSTLSGLADVNFSSLTQGDLLIYDGAEWINHSFTEGHDILNESGSAVTARDNLQFTDGLKVTDDSGNNKTKVGVNTTFTEASTRANIDSGDTFSTILGKIKKWFTDIPSLFVSKTGDTMSGTLYIEKLGTSQSQEFSRLYLGNNIPYGTSENSTGFLRLYAKGSGRVDIFDKEGIVTGNRILQVPDKSGTIALTSDVSAKVSKSGDTMTGLLTIKRSAELQLALTRDHSDTTVKETRLGIGNQTPNGTAGACYGAITFWGDGAYGAELQARNMTANRTHQLPDDSGEIALKGALYSVIALGLGGSPTALGYPGTWKQLDITVKTVGDNVQKYLWIRVS